MEDYSAFVADAASSAAAVSAQGSSACNAVGPTADEAVMESGGKNGDEEVVEEEYEPSWQVRQRAKEQLDTDNRALYDLIYKYVLHFLSGGGKRVRECKREASNHPVYSFACRCVAPQPCVHLQNPPEQIHHYTFLFLSAFTDRCRQLCPREGGKAIKTLNRTAQKHSKGK